MDTMDNIIGWCQCLKLLMLLDVESDLDPSDPIYIRIKSLKAEYEALLDTVKEVK